jgi:hypothetical protein
LEPSLRCAKCSEHDFVAQDASVVGLLLTRTFNKKKGSVLLSFLIKKGLPVEFDRFVALCKSQQHVFSSIVWKPVNNMSRGMMDELEEKK